VSLEPVWSTHDDEARLYFSGTLGEPRGARTPEPDPLADESWPEPIVDGEIDLGEAVVQLMAEALDPYPRLPEEGADTA
jgi:hypothetical protein